MDAPTPAQFVEAYFGLRAQAEKLQRIEDRLERMAALAEESKSLHGVAQVAAQQLRSVEIGAKVAGTGGYAAQKGGNDGQGGSPFSVNVYFASTGQTVSITPVSQPRADRVANGVADTEDSELDEHLSPAASSRMGFTAGVIEADRRA